jgi:hypothetical protein
VSYQTSETTTEWVTSYSYIQDGLFDFTISLKNNTVYDTSIITPGQDFIFKKTIDTIEGSFHYQYTGSETEIINGIYQHTITLKTDYWEKRYVIIPEQVFTFSDKTSGFNFSFPVNISFYEAIIEEINKEIGLRAQNPLLIITCDVMLSSQTSKGELSDRFSPFVQIKLGDYLLEFTEDLSQSESGFLRQEKEIYHQHIRDNKHILTVLSICCVVTLAIFIFSTKDIVIKKHPMEIMIQKWKKKYAEWLVEVENPPKLVQYTERIQLHSLEDLNRVAEEIGKPLLSYRTEMNGTVKQSFYVIDAPTVYEYSLIYDEHTLVIGSQ